MASGNAMEEAAAGDSQNASENEAESAVERALSDAARQADPVPAAVVDAAKQAHERRLGGAASADDEIAEAASPGTSGTKRSVAT